MSSKLKNNIKKIFLITFCNSLIFAYVIERIFAQERGLSVLQMQMILILYAVISLVLEIPSGILADKWKKKYVLAIGFGFCSLEFLISIYAYSFPVFCFAFLGAAIGGSLRSGTMESLLFQTLKDLQREQEYEKLLGYLKFFKYGSSAVIAMIGGYVADHTDLVVNYWLSLIGFPFAILISLTLTEPHFEKAKDSSYSFWSHFSTAFQLVKQDPTLIRVMIYSGITSAALYGELHEMSSLKYENIGISIGFFGVVSFCATTLGGLSGVLSGWIKDKLGYTNAFKLILFSSSLLIGLWGMSTHWWGVIYLLLAILLLEMVPQLTSGYLQNRIKDQFRVTIHSFDAFMKNGLSMLIGILFGYISDRFSVSYGFVVLSVVLILYAVIYLISERKTDPVIEV